MFVEGGMLLSQLTPRCGIWLVYVCEIQYRNTSAEFIQYPVTKYPLQSNIQKRYNK